MNSMRTDFGKTLHVSWITAAIGWGCLTAGCERKERVIDIKTPGASIEVDKTQDGLEIKTKRDPDKEIDIEVPGADIEIKKD